MLATAHQPNVTVTVKVKVDQLLPTTASVHPHPSQEAEGTTTLSPTPTRTTRSRREAREVQAGGRGAEGTAEMAIREMVSSQPLFPSFSLASSRVARPQRPAFLETRTTNTKKKEEKSFQVFYSSAATSGFQRTLFPRGLDSQITAQKLSRETRWHARR